MALFGVNFSVYFLLLLREWRGALLDEELLLYGGIMLTAMFVIAADITPLFSGFGEDVYKRQPYFLELTAFPAYAPVQQATVEANGEAWAVDAATYIGKMCIRDRHRGADWPPQK